MKLVAIDSSCASVEEWDLGSINIWFAEGQYEGNNLHMNARYFPHKETIATFPPADSKEKNPIVSCQSNRAYL